MSSVLAVQKFPIPNKAATQVLQTVSKSGDAASFIAVLDIRLLVCPKLLAEDWSLATAVVPRGGEIECAAFAC